MADLFYTVTVAPIIVWVIGFLGYNAEGTFHILLVITIIAIILKYGSGTKIHVTANNT